MHRFNIPLILRHLVYFTVLQLLFYLDLFTCIECKVICDILNDFLSSLRYNVVNVMNFYLRKFQVFWSIFWTFSPVFLTQPIFTLCTSDQSKWWHCIKLTSHAFGIRRALASVLRGKKLSCNTMPIYINVCLKWRQISQWYYYIDVI